MVGQIVIDSDKIVLQNKELHVKDQKGRTLLYADDEKIKLDIQNMHFTGKFFFHLIGGGC